MERIQWSYCNRYPMTTMNSVRNRVEGLVVKGIDLGPGSFRYIDTVLILVESKLRRKIRNRKDPEGR